MRRFGTIFKICIIEECRNECLAKTFCSKHYTRYRRHNSPHVLKRERGKGNSKKERFWSRVKISNTVNMCWTWTGAKSGMGYGSILYNKKVIGAHVMSWFFTKGSWPKYFLLHSCDNPLCVNPRHLREGTQQENMLEAIARGRMKIGEDRSFSKLNNFQVLEIKKLISDGISPNIIANSYNVASGTIYSIKNEKSWKHVRLT